MQELWVKAGVCARLDGENHFSTFLSKNHKQFTKNVLMISKASADNLISSPLMRKKISFSTTLTTQSLLKWSCSSILVGGLSIQALESTSMDAIPRLQPKMFVFEVSTSFGDASELWHLFYRHQQIWEIMNNNKKYNKSLKWNNVTILEQLSDFVKN